MQIRFAAVPALLLAGLLLGPVYPAHAQEDSSATRTLRPAEIGSEDVSRSEVEAAAEIVVAMQMQQQKMRTRMREKYGNPQEMDSTQRRKARQEVMSTRRAQSFPRAATRWPPPARRAPPRPFGKAE